MSGWPYDKEMNSDNPKYDIWNLIELLEYDRKRNRFKNTDFDSIRLNELDRKFRRYIKEIKQFEKSLDI